MGFWKKLLGVGEIGAGIAFGQPGLIAAGAGTLAADSQGESAKKANEQQQAATNKAQGTLDQVYQQTRQDLSPYQSIGSSSAATLSSLMGLPSGAGGAGGLPTNVAVRDGEIGRMASRDPNTPTNRVFVNEQQYDGGQAIPRSLATLAAPVQTQSGFVTVMSPDGRTGQIPAGMVDQAVARGGRVVGGVS